MNDMRSVIVPKSDQINADDLIASTMTITVTSVQIKGGQDQPVSIYFEGSDKAFRPCKSMSRVLVAGWGPDASKYAGRSVTLYRDPTVKWGGMEVGGIRISHMSHIDKPLVMALTATKGSRKMHTVQPLKIEQQQRSGGTEDKAAAWVDSFITRVDEITSIDELAAFEGDKSARIAELETKRPELGQKVRDAVKARFAALAADDDDDDNQGEGT